MRKYLPALDGLRALAVISVILVHVNSLNGDTFGRGRLDTILSRWWGAGWVGVDLFFVLSGFLITGILYEAKRSSHYFRNFYARRCLRIMPVYLGCLFVAGILLHSVTQVSRADFLSLGLYYYNFRVAATHMPEPWFHIFWSLCIEEHFYALWPLCVWALRRSALKRLCLLGAGLAFLLRVLLITSGAWVQVPYLITPCRLDGLLLGAFVALCWRDATEWQALRRHAPAVCGCAALGIMAIACWLTHFADFVDHRWMRMSNPLPDSRVVVTIGITAVSLFFTSVLVMVLDNRWGLGDKFAWAPLVKIGKYSYGIYVFHIILMRCIEPPFERAAEYIPIVAVKIALATCVIGLTYLIAALSFRFYEEPFLRLKRYFSD